MLPTRQFQLELGANDMEPGAAKRPAPAPARADAPASASNTHETTPRNIDGRVWSLRPSESLGTLRQVPVLFAVLDCLDGRALARLEMTSIALERSARAAAARRARMLNYPPPVAGAYSRAKQPLDWDPEAVGAWYLRAAPFRPMPACSAYIWFSMEQRKSMPKGMPIGEMARQIGEMWGRFSEVAKLPYQNMANDDKSRYQRDMALYFEQRRHAGDFKTWRNPVSHALRSLSSSARLQKGRASVSFGPRHC
jgi:hypothetical protein